ncbi:MAG: efflux RND transporter periplasmic adaptor subunit [bacterium]
MRWRRRIGIVILLLVIILAIGYGFMPRPVTVEIIRVKRGPLRVTVEEEGKTRVIDRYLVSSPVAGLARRIELKVGDPVTRGQVLVVLDPMQPNLLDPRLRAEAEARVAAARAALKAAQEEADSAGAMADFAAKERVRLEKLYRGGYIPQDKWDKAEAEARQTRALQRSAEFAVEVARFELEAARAALQYTADQDTRGRAKSVEVKSATDGRILKVYQESAGVVSTGQPLLEIGDPRFLEVAVDVLSSEAVRIRPGMPVIFEHWGEDDPLEGRVRLVEPYGFTKISALGVEEQRVLVIADIISPPERWAGLGDGYRVEASFILWEEDNVLQIPTSALFRFGEGWAVFVMEGNRARRRQVLVGHWSGLMAEIIDGLAEGEAVIPHPADAIDEGTRLRLRKP